uniref:CXXC-type domain-containing protein n=1 Tax=Panagrolaimus sp. JU765 TaxID=591449 RepID=A0AC34R2V5_9BILA
MSTLTSVGPMVISGSMQQAGQQMQMMAPNPVALSAQYLAPNGSPYPHQLTAVYRAPVGSTSGSSSSSTSSTSSAAINRSQRCGICRGCQCKPCGTCTYCQDSPQFGGPGVKKQSCIERRCHRVLENRLQRDAPTFKARVGCNNCDDCRMPDCQVCLVCLDKRFFDNRYMTGALCAKKRCNNATSLELPSQQQQNQTNNNQQSMKRSFDSTGQANYDYVMAKRRTIEMQQQQQTMQMPTQNGIQLQNQQRVMTISAPMPNGDQNGYQTQQIMGNTIRIIPHQSLPGQHMNLLVPMSNADNQQTNQQPTQSQAQVVEVMPIKQETQQSIAPINGSNGPTVMTVPHSLSIQTLQPQNGVYTHYVQSIDMMGQMQNGVMQPQFAYVPSQKMFSYPKYEPKYEYYDCDSTNSPHQDPYVPPSYSTDVKNGVVLQPL